MTGAVNSGSAVDDDRELTMIYTGHGFVDPDPLTRSINQSPQTRSIAGGPAAATFVEYPRHSVIHHPPADSAHPLRRIRRCGVARTSWCMVLGDGSRRGQARVVCRSTNPGLRLPRCPPRVGRVDRLHPRMPRPLSARQQAHPARTSPIGIRQVRRHSRPSSMPGRSSGRSTTTPTGSRTGPTSISTMGTTSTPPRRCRLRTGAAWPSAG